MHQVQVGTNYRSTSEKPQSARLSTGARARETGLLAAGTEVLVVHAGLSPKTDGNNVPEGMRQCRQRDGA